MENLQENWKTIGNTRVKQILSGHLARPTLPHAYLFAGPQGTNKRNLSAEFAEKIIGKGSQFNITIHDVSEHGSVEEMRDILQAAALVPFSGGRKVIILQNVHTLLPTSGNVLLKTLEEPKPNTFFLLVSDTPHILATIMSRCQILQCKLLSNEEITEYARDEAILISDESLISLAGGSITRLKLLTGTEKNTSEIMLTISTIETGLAAGVMEKMAVINKLANLENPILVEALQSLMHKQIAQLSHKPEIYKLIQVSLETLKRLQKNFNKKMVLEYFMLNAV